MLDTKNYYAIGTPGVKWGDEEKKEWFDQQKIKRSYKEEVASKIENLRAYFNVEEYGELEYLSKYKLYAVKSISWDNSKPNILVTGGVHGYETSGVQGALRFLKDEAQKYSDKFNILVLPSISPWGYETINRWNPLAIDPNRSFYKDSPAKESSFVIDYISSLGIKFLAHIDLHETTDTDESEFRPALAARDGVDYAADGVPDGFYLVGDTERPEPEFQKAIIDSVRKVTHIAPPDADGKIIGKQIEQEGVINYDTKKLGLCIGFSDAKFSTTTEVYPDSPKATDEECILAQVAAVTGALDFLIKTNQK